MITRYLRLVLWPHPLAIAYDWPQATPFATGLPGFALVAALFVATLWALWRRLPIGFAGACVFLLLAPSSSLVPLPSEIAAERRMYLPSAFLIAALVVFAWQGLARVVNAPSRTRVALAATAIAGLALAFASRDRLADYRSALSIWEDAARKSPNHSTVRNNYGRELVLAGRHAEAVPHLRASIAMRAENPVPHYLLGVALLGSGDVAAAQPPLREAIRLRPEMVDAHFTLGRALAASKDWGGAAHEYQEVLRLKPDDGEGRVELARAYNNQASALMREGRSEEALRFLQEAVRLNPTYALGHVNLGNAFAATGQFDRAVPAWLQAVRVAPQDARVRAMIVDRLRGLPPAARGLIAPALQDGDAAVREVAGVALPRPGVATRPSGRTPGSGS